MVILGIDPGYATVGWGAVEYTNFKFKPLGYGAIQTPKEEPVERRLEMIYSGMIKLIDRFEPEQISVEELFFNTNITTGIKVGEARGVILLSAVHKGVDIFEYTPLQVKQSVVGYGRAEKKQVMEMVTRILGLREIPRPDDAADALALAICHAHSGCSKLAQYYNK